MHNAIILIVDDDPISLRAIAQCLKDRYRICVLNSGIDALEYLKDHTVDLILLDINMPNMDGFAVAKQLQRDSSKIPIIFLTADSSPNTFIKAFQLGAVDYIAKPFHPEEVLVRVKNRIHSDFLQKHLYAALKTNSKLLEMIDKHIAYLKFDIDETIEEVSESLCLQLKCHHYDLKGKKLVDYLHFNFLSSVNNEALDGLVFGDSIEIEHPCTLMGGETIWYGITITPNFSDFGKKEGYYAFFHNIDAKIFYQNASKTDRLTGLINRFGIDEILTNEIYRVQRSHTKLSVILVDIDHFKEINDTFGHQVGDAVLQEISNLLTMNTRKTDFVGRWGGEEFLIILPNTDGSNALFRAELLRQKIENYTFVAGCGNQTCSFGVAQYVPENDLQKLFKQVDNALYNAKKSGRNKVMHYNE